MVDITIGEITDTTLNGLGYFDKFMTSVNTHLKEQYDKHRIKSSEYSSVYLGAMQSALTEAVKLAIGRQLASAQADLAIVNTSKIEIDKDLVRAEILYKGELTANAHTENGLITERITNLEKDTLVKIQDELVKKKEVLLMQSRIEKSAKEIDKLTADIARVNQDTANALSQNAVIVAEAARVIATTLKIGKDTDLVVKQIDKTTSQIHLLTQDILVRAKEVQLQISRISLMEKQRLQVIAETALTAERVVHTSKQIEKLTEDIKAVTANTKLTVVKVDQTVCETSKCGIERELLEARVITEKANTDGTVIGVDSVLGEGISLKRQQTITERANVDSSVVGVDSILDHRNTKIKIDGEVIKASYQPVGIVDSGSKLDCETKLSCAKITTEKANYTSIGSSIGDIAPDSLLGARAKLTFAQAETEEANLDPEHVKPNSLYEAKIAKMEADANNALANYNPTDAGVVAGSKIDCDTKLACAKAESERANYTPIGDGLEEIAPTSLLGARADLLIQQKATEKANTDGEDVTNDSLMKHRIDKMKSDANTALANYDPVSAGVTEGSKIDCDAKLQCARVKSEAANYTEIGNEPDQIDPTSYLGARTELLINQSKTEQANTDGSLLTSDSFLQAKIDKAQADAKAVIATYDPIQAEVKGGSKLDCETRLACARAESERANYTAIGDSDGLISPDSLLGARANLLIRQGDTEEANIDPHKVQPDSVYQAKIDKMVADANNSLANYDPTAAGVQENSKLSCDTKLACAKAESEKANYTPIGLGIAEISPTSLLGARADLLIQQKATEKANINGDDVKSNSLLKHRIDKMEFDARASLATFNPDEAEVQEGSKLDCEAKLTCARVLSEQANYTKIGNDPGEIDPNSYLGARAGLLINQTKTELANTDGTGLEDNSLLKSKIDKAKADVRVSVAQYNPIEAEVQSGSLLDCNAKLSCAKTEVELAQLQPLGVNEGQLEPTSVLGSRANLINKQAITEQANTDPLVIKAGSLIQSKLDKAQADARVSLAQIDPVGAEVRVDSVVDCNAKLTCAKVKSESANYTPIGEGENFIHPTSFLGARTDLLVKQINTEEANYDASKVEDDSLIRSRIDKAKYDAQEALSKYDPVTAGVQEGSLLDCNAKLACAKARTEEAQFTEIGNDPDQIDPTSFLGARTDLLIQQAGSEKANFDATHVKEGSMISARIDKMESDANNALSQYNPELAGVQENSLTDCKTKLTCAQATVELAQIQDVGTGEGELSPDSLLGAKATLLGYQSDSEKANTDGTNIGETSFMRYRVNKMEADAKVALAPLQGIGSGTNQVRADSTMGLKAKLVKNQALTEQANVDASGISTDSFIDAKIEFLKSQKLNMESRTDLTDEQAIATKAEYDSSVVVDGSLLDCKAKLSCAQAGEVLANYTVALDSEGKPVPVNETTLLGAKYNLANEQFLTEQANNEEPTAGLSLQKFNLGKAQVEEVLAKVEGATSPSIMYWNEQLAEMKAKFESAKYNNTNVTDGSWFAAQRDLAIAQTKEAEGRATNTPVSGTIQEQQLKLLEAQVAAEELKEDISNAQVDLYEAQKDHFVADTKFKKAKLYVDMYTTSLTQDADTAIVTVKTDASNAVDLI